jgi:hypothetical protein
MKEISSLYFGLRVFRQFEARFRKLDVVYSSTANPLYFGEEVVTYLYDSTVSSTKMKGDFLKEMLRRDSMLPSTPLPPAATTIHNPS